MENGNSMTCDKKSVKLWISSLEKETMMGHMILNWPRELREEGGGRPFIVGGSGLLSIMTNLRFIKYDSICTHDL